MPAAPGTVSDPSQADRRRVRPGRIWALNAGIAAAASLLFVAWVRHLPGPAGTVRIPWALLAGMFCLGEVCVVHFEFRRDAHTFSMGEIPLVIGLFFADPSALVLAQVAGAAAALILHRRQPPTKLAFNLSQFALQAGLAVTVFHAFAPSNDPTDPVSWAAALAATFAVLVSADVLINAAIRLSGGDLGRVTWFGMFGLGAAVTATNTSLGLVAATILSRAPQATWLLVVPTGAALLAYRSYSSARLRKEALDSLHESMRVAQESLQSESAVLALMSQVRGLFQADVAELTLFPPDDGGVALRTTLGPGAQVEVVKPVRVDPGEGFRGRAAEGGCGIIVTTPTLSRRSRDDGRVSRLRDAMVAPLHGETSVVGTLLVANRLGDVGSFGSEELELLETLATHLGTSLENDRLGGLRESVAQLREANRLKDDFAAMVSHELRSPLTVIQGNVKTLLREDIVLGSEDHRSFLQSISRHSDRLGRMFEDLLALSRLESGGERIDATIESLPGLALQVADDLRDATAGHVVAFAFDPTLPVVETDGAKVRQILSNLMENAVKYTPVGTRVTIRARGEGADVVLSVEDEGPGIPPAQHSRIFDRFFQLDQSTTRPVGGVGLGLYICRRLADSMGGRLWLERSDERGSLFSLAIPLEPPASEELPEAAEAG